MRTRYQDPRKRHLTRGLTLLLLAFVVVGVGGATTLSRKPASINAETPAGSVSIAPSAMAVINVRDLAAKQALGEATAPPVRPLLIDELDEPGEEVAAPGTNAAFPIQPLFAAPPHINVASPAPSTSYPGLDDIPMADSSYIIIPPDVDGAVGPTKVMEGLNNNYRIRDKATGVTQLTVGTATFWAPVTLPTERLSLTDPRTTYDEYNQCWIAVMQTVGLSGSILVAVSQTSDPAGSWYEYKFTGLSGSLGTAYQLDYPILGYNKNWVAVNINRYTSGGSFSYSICLALNYPQLRAGSGSGTLFTLNTGGGGTHFCASPTITYSATEESLFVITHLSSPGATYVVDVISGTAAAPVFNLAAASNVRPGGGWVQPSGNQQPQSLPVAGTPACSGGAACKIESQDSYVRSAPIYRNGYLYYAQTIGLPAGALTHTGVQWTKITPSTTPLFVEGGRLEDPTATATNGGFWYDNTSLAVNAAGDFILGFTQFSSAQHPSAGYAMHINADGPGTLRDAFISHPGEDYYHKTFTTTTGRNRWGDFSTCQVDPCDDMTLWTIQEYAKTRTGVDDGNTGSNSSKWATWWAAVGGANRAATLTCNPDSVKAPGATEVATFRITNSGSATDQFSWTISDVNGWGGPCSGTTPPLPPGGFVDVSCVFTVSPNCSPISDDVTLSVLPAGGAACYSSQTCVSHIYCDYATATLVSHFDAEQAASGIDLAWASEAVGEVQSWTVYRSLTPDGAWESVNDAPIAMGAGGEFKLHDDAGSSSGTVYYRLDGRLASGQDGTLGTTSLTLGAGRAISFAISGGNPFTKNTTLRYTLPHPGVVHIDVYSVAGQRVRSLVNRFEAPGSYSVDFSLRGGDTPLKPGVYLVRMSAGSYHKSLRLVGIE